MKCEICSETSRLHLITDKDKKKIQVCCDCYLTQIGSACTCSAVESPQMVLPTSEKEEYFAAGIRCHMLHVRPDTAALVRKDMVEFGLKAYETEKAKQ